VKMSDDAWEALDWHIDEQEALRNKIAKLLEDASHSIQFCNDCKEVVEVLTNLLNDLVKVLKV